MILLGCKGLGDSERLSQGYLLFLWKILHFFLAWVPPLCLDTEYICFLGEKSATMLHFCAAHSGVYCETKHCPSSVLGICYTLFLWAGSAGSAGAICWHCVWMCVDLQLSFRGIPAAQRLLPPCLLHLGSL